MKRLFILFFFSISILSNSATIKVKSFSELLQAINSASPGDVIAVAQGVYDISENILITKKGTKDKPITIEAETTGTVEIKGTNGITISSESAFITIKGFKFHNNTGTIRIEPGATHCLITRNIFECSPVNSGAKPYLNVSGDDNEVSYNTFRNKLDEGQMLSIQGPGSDKMAKRTWIHHNYFYNFPPKSNNCSAIQVGLSGRSMDSAFCIIEYNLFIRCAGENEGAICNKSCNNIYRFNTFGEGTEELSLRHGNKCQVYGNFFLGSTGLRFSGDDHKIYSNYFNVCSEAIVCTNGDGEVREGSKLTCHDRSDRVNVSYNTLVNCKNNYRMPARDKGLGATSITFSNNIISGGAPVSIKGIFPNGIWLDNILWNTSGGDMPASGYKVSNPGLQENDYRINRFGSIPASNIPLTINEAGNEAAKSGK
jgi:poly(beta-D-mannuronate) lyase